MSTADEFRAKYQMLGKVADDRIITYQAKEPTGRVVMVHIFERGATPANNEWLSLLARLASQETLVLERAEVNGQPVVVTPMLESFQSLPVWLENRTRAARDDVGAGAWAASDPALPPVEDSPARPPEQPPPAAPTRPAASHQAPAPSAPRQPVEPPPVKTPAAVRPAPSPGPSESPRAGSEPPVDPKADPYIQSLPYEVVGRRPIRALVDFIRRRGFILFLLAVLIWLFWFS